MECYVHWTGHGAAAKELERIHIRCYRRLRIGGTGGFNAEQVGIWAARLRIVGPVTVSSAVEWILAVASKAILNTGDKRSNPMPILDVAIGKRKVFTIVMAAARHIRVRELVDEDKLRPALQDGVEIHLGEYAALVRQALLRDDLEALGEAIGLDAAMRLDDADDDIDALEPPLPALPPGENSDPCR